MFYVFIKYLHFFLVTKVKLPRGSKISLRYVFSAVISVANSASNMLNNVILHSAVVIIESPTQFSLNSLNISVANIT